MICTVPCGKKWSTVQVLFTICKILCMKISEQLMQWHLAFLETVIVGPLPTKHKEALLNTSMK